MSKNNKKQEIRIEEEKPRKNKTYTIAMTSMFGTYIAGKFKAKNGGGACSKARAKFGKDWTYYVF